MESRRRAGQRGAVLVEFAITVSLFLLVTLGIIEFALLVFDMSRANEMIRQLSRLAITADPVCDVFGTRSALGTCTGTLTIDNTDPSNPVCQGGPVIESLDQVDTTPGTPGPTGYRMLERAQALLPDVQASQIQIVYTCSDVGYSGRPLPVPLVTVSLQNYSRAFLLTGFLGIGAGIGFPAFEVTRIGEDLWTEG